jgi:AraC family transcriptional regulator
MFMHNVQQSGPPAAPKPTDSRKGVACISTTESQWSNGLISAAVRHYEGAEGELQYLWRKHALMLTLGGSSGLTGVKISGSPVYEGRDKAGCVTYVPADTERRAWYRNDNVDLLLLLIDPRFLRSCEFATDAPGPLPFTNQYDPLLQSLLWSLAHEMRDGTAEVPSLYAEHTAGLLMAHLMHSVPRGRAERPCRAGLSEITRRRVVDFIEENLGQDISLTRLAALAGTGVDAFARNFKASMGLPPYRYVVERRMRRAQALLAANDKSIAQIAYEVGFPAQAHFTTQFGKFMKMSPAAYRALHRG